MKLRAENLMKSYKGRKVVNGISIEVNQGEIVGLLGPNGAGKTTSFYMIVGLIKPNGGTIYLDHQEITKYPMYKRAQHGIGYLAQEASIFRKLSVEDNILSVLQLTKFSKKEQKEKMESLIEEFGLGHIRKNRGDLLSGGERRRTEIARALATDPHFILLDEPFAGVDPVAVEDIQRIIDKVDADKFNAKFSAEAQIENNALKFTLKQLDDKVVNSDTSTAMTIAPGPGKTASPIVDPGSGAYTSSFPFINSVEETVRYLQTANREITTVVWHWSGHYTDQGYVGSQEIDKSHKKKGLNEIGYHFIIKRDGSLQVGRNINKTGAHTAGFNDRSIGIAFVAGYKCTSDKYEGVPPTSEVGKASITQAQMKAFWFFMLAWYKAAPGGQAWGHNDFRARGHSDPGFDVHDAVFNMFHKHNVGHPWVDSKILTTREISIKTAHNDTLEKVVEPGTLDTPKKLTIFEKRDKFVAEQKVAALGIGV